MQVLLLDDHPLILAALSPLLSRLRQDVAVTAVSTPAQAFEALGAGAPFALALIDLDLGCGADGFAVLQRLRDEHPAIPVVVLSATDRVDDVVRAIDLGAMGFVPKRSPNGELRDALSLVLDGGIYLPAGLLAMLAGRADAGPFSWTAPAGGLHVAEPRPRDRADGTAPWPSARPLAGPAGTTIDAAAGTPSGPRPSLTPRQSQVLGLLLRGLPNKLIARELGLSVDTVKDHVAAVLRGLGVTTRTQAVLAAARLGTSG